MGKIKTKLAFKNQFLKTILCFGLLALFVGVSWSLWSRYSASELEYFQSLKAQSENFFEYAKVNPGKLSNQKLRALSIGIAFRDTRLVESSLAVLKSQKDGS